MPIVGAAQVGGAVQMAQVSETVRDSISLGPGLERAARLQIGRKSGHKKVVGFFLYYKNVQDGGANQHRNPSSERLPNQRSLKAFT
jgi:hypothetical protein